jgi:hypothetical protein
MAFVGLVTAADKSSPSVQAFKDEGNKIGWAPGTVQLYGPSPSEIQMAHDDVKAVGGVLVAAGQQTAFDVQAKTPPTDKIPIIVAYAGAVPDNADTNMMGFIGDSVTVATNHLGLLKKAGLAVTVMYDPSAHNKMTQKVLKALTNFTGLPIRPADMEDMTAAQLAAQLNTTGFMLIPNATYFEYAKVISDAVDSADAVTMAYYPEAEYWRQHQSKGKAHLSGFNVPLTYRLAAGWVDNFFTGTYSIDDMPKKKFAKAIPDPYPPTF